MAWKAFSLKVIVGVPEEVQEASLWLNETQVT